MKPAASTRTALTLTTLSVGVLAGALAGSARAQSSVTITGTLDGYVGSMRMAGDATRLKVMNSGGMTTSYLGFIGKEDLGGGLKATFALTAFLRDDTGQSGRFNGDPFFARDANVGLAGSFGSVLVGRAKAPNFLPTVFVNPFGDSFGFSPLVLHANVNTAKWTYATTPSDTGWANQVTYTTPSFANMTANLQYQFGEQTTSTGAGSGRGNVGGNVLYLGGPLTLVAFYERDQVTNPTPALITATIGGTATPVTRKDWMVGGAYDASIVKGFASFGRSTTELTNYVGTTSSVGISVPVGVGFILADVAHTKVSGPFNGTRNTGSLEYDYFLSKRTDVYAVAMQDRVTAQANGNSIALGVRHRF